MPIKVRIENLSKSCGSETRRRRRFTKLNPQRTTHQPETRALLQRYSSRTPSPSRNGSWDGGSVQEEQRRYTVQLI